jgi:hypothetical protein
MTYTKKKVRRALSKTTKCQQTKTEKMKTEKMKKIKTRKGGNTDNVAIQHLQFQKLTNEMTPTLYRGKMTETDNERLVKISERFITSKPNKLKSKDFYCEQISGDEDLKYIKNWAYEILSALDFYVNPNECMIEFWSYNASGRKVVTTLDLHKDDYGVLNDRVDTVIFYTRKDDTLEGGNLKINEVLKQYKILFGLGKWHSRKVKTIEINKNDIIVFNGNLEHQPEDVSGNGVRDCIVVQFKSKRKLLKNKI